jgi:hypothetical protein
MNKHMTALQRVSGATVIALQPYFQLHERAYAAGFADTGKCVM